MSPSKEDRNAKRRLKYKENNKSAKKYLPVKPNNLAIGQQLPPQCPVKPQKLALGPHVPRYSVVKPPTLQEKLNLLCPNNEVEVDVHSVGVNNSNAANIELFEYQNNPCQPVLEFQEEEDEFNDILFEAPMLPQNVEVAEVPFVKIHYYNISGISSMYIYTSKQRESRVLIENIIANMKDMLLLIDPGKLHKQSMVNFIGRLEENNNIVIQSPVEHLTLGGDMIVLANREKYQVGLNFVL